MTTNRPQRLSKRDVERLLATYDADPVGALQTALRRLFDRPNATFEELIKTLADAGRLSVERWRALEGRDVDSLDSLAAELNETRMLPS
jgi:hypothetical protein